MPWTAWRKRQPEIQDCLNSCFKARMAQRNRHIEIAPTYREVMITQTMLRDVLQCRRGNTYAGSEWPHTRRTVMAGITSSSSPSLPLVSLLLSS